MENEVISWDPAHIQESNGTKNDFLSSPWRKTNELQDPSPPKKEKTFRQTTDNTHGRARRKSSSGTNTLMKKKFNFFK